MESEIKHNMEEFIARRLYGAKEKKQGGTQPAIIIATIGIALGLAVMLVTLSITRGFKNQIRDIVVGFTQHINISSNILGSNRIDSNIVVSNEMIDSLSNRPSIEYAQRYICKAGIIKTDTLFHGFMLKGIAREYRIDNLKEYLIDGDIPSPTDSTENWIVVSKRIADKLGIGVGSNAELYFMQNNIRARRAIVVGIYQTNFSEYDQLYCITSIDMLQRLNGWDSDHCTGVEVRVAEGEELYQGYLDCRSVIDRLSTKYGDNYLVTTIEEINSSLFNWLDVLNMNVLAILVLMVGISGFTMVSGLLIIIFERTHTIAILKSLGAKNRTIRAIFIRLGVKIVGRGTIIGNTIGLSLIVLQRSWHIIPLDPQSYYIDYVPMDFGMGWIITINAIMFILSMLMLLIPTLVISKIHPSRALRFE